MAKNDPPDPKTLPNRLRGIYVIPVNDGLGLLNGKDTFTRNFGNQGSLQERAAQMIERLEKGEYVDLDEINKLAAELMQPDDPMNIGKLYVVPIRKEAAERLQDLYIPF